MLLNNYTSAPDTISRLNLPNEARRRPAIIRLQKRAGCQAESKALEKSCIVDSGKGCSRARLGFVKPFQNGLRKVKNLTNSKLAVMETDLVERENGIGIQKEE